MFCTYTNAGYTEANNSKLQQRLKQNHYWKSCKCSITAGWKDLYSYCPDCRKPESRNRCVKM